MINLCLWLLAGALAGGAASRIPSALAPNDGVINSIAGILRSAALMVSPQGYGA
jgi:hypothetical protein